VYSIERRLIMRVRYGPGKIDGEVDELVVAQCQDDQQRQRPEPERHVLQSCGRAAHSVSSSLVLALSLSLSLCHPLRSMVPRTRTARPPALRPRVKLGCEAAVRAMSPSEAFTATHASPHSPEAISSRLLPCPRDAERGAEQAPACKSPLWMP
jgi:hypothetical protein